jgi:hypothetical protein
VTALAAGTVVLHFLFAPPLASTGIAEAGLSGIPMLIAIWFVCRDPSSRMLTYGLVGTLASVFFSLIWLSHFDIVFHTRREPPQWIIAAL